MDRGRSFSMLGLSETATKEQVKAAYERKVAKYKGPDYAEERAYAERKLAQLYHAYQEAYEAAENGPGRYQPSRIERDAEKPEQKKAPKTNRLLEEERDAADHNKREKFHQWMERRDDEKSKRKDGKGTSKPKLEKPDFSKLKDKLKEIKEEVAAELHFSEEEEADNAGMETLAKDIASEDDEFADFAKGCIYTEEETPVGRTIPQAEVEDHDDDFYDSDNTESSSESEGFNIEIVKLLISLAVIIFTFVGGCGDDGLDDDYDYEMGGSYIYDQYIDDIRETDVEIADLAEQSSALLLSQKEYHMATIEASDLRLEDKADSFANLYWKKESLAEVTTDLCENYMDYHVDTTCTIEEQLDGIFAFYGFASLDTAEFYEQPYTGGRIESYCDYLDYLNQFYEEL